eukprot:3522541-Prymnesium_polylepis.1
MTRTTSDTATSRGSRPSPTRGRISPAPLWSRRATRPAPRRCWRRSARLQAAHAGERGAVRPRLQHPRGEVRDFEEELRSPRPRAS